MSSRTGKAAQDIFSPTRRIAKMEAPAPAPQVPAESHQSTSNPGQAETPQNGSKRGPGRPPVHDERWAKATVILLNRHIVFLDRLSSDIREKTGRAIKRAELIRALIEMLSESDIDLTSATSEADIKARLVEAVAS